MDITVARCGTETVIEQVDGKHIEVIEGMVEAPLWGMPPLEHEQGQESKLKRVSVKEKGAHEDESKDT